MEIVQFQLAQIGGVSAGMAPADSERGGVSRSPRKVSLGRQSACESPYPAGLEGGPGQRHLKVRWKARLTGMGWRLPRWRQDSRPLQAAGQGLLHSILSA
jgi:hypothetical protein